MAHEYILVKADITMHTSLNVPSWDNRGPNQGTSCLQITETYERQRETMELSLETHNSYSELHVTILN